MVKLTDVTQQPIIHIDGTPDNGYVLRILVAYRENCNCRWVSEPEPNALVDLMNEHCEQRARLLDEAIEKLSR